MKYPQWMDKVSQHLQEANGITSTDLALVVSPPWFEWFCSGMAAATAAAAAWTMYTDHMDDLAW